MITGPSFPPLYFYSTIFLEIVLTFSDCIIRKFCTGYKGLPNVGKSSVINSLKRKKTCGVGACPGITK